MRSALVTMIVVLLAFIRQRWLVRPIVFYAVKKDWAWPILHLKAGYIYETRDNPDQAKRHYLKALNGFSQKFPFGPMHAAGGLFRIEAYEEAAQAYADIEKAWTEVYKEVRADEADEEVFADYAYWRGAALSKIGREDEAIPHLQRGAHSSECRDYALRTLSYCQRRTGDLEAALDTTELALSTSPDDLWLLIHRVYLLAEIQNAPEASDAADVVATRLEKTWDDAYAHLFDCAVYSLGAIGLIDEAQRIVAAALQHEPHSVHILIAAANAASFQQDYATSLTYAEQAVEQFPNECHAHLIHASVLQALGRRDDAIAALQNAYRLDPDDPRVHDRAKELDVDLDA